MAIIGIGNDIIEIERIKHSIEQTKDKFLNRIYLKEEQLYCKKKGEESWASYAVRFAFKEAVEKALPKNIADKLSWNDVGTIPNKDMKPILITSEKGKDVLAPFRFHISLSHNRTQAIANVLIETVD